jgi:hypothetical protein
MAMVDKDAADGWGTVALRDALETLGDLEHPGETLQK